MSSEASATKEPQRSGSRKWLWLAILVAAIGAVAVGYIVAPPFPKDAPGEACAYPVCFINSTLEFPNPHVVYDFSPETAPEGLPLIQFHPSISASLLTLWIVMGVLLVVAIPLMRRTDRVPGRAQNVVEAIYEALQGFAVSIGGPGARRYVPLFASLFILILASNWSGLLPPVGRIHEFRAPTSDVNTTIGLALVSFFIFHIEGVRSLGLRAYLGKFFPIREFRNGVGAGIIAMFVGLVELMLEFVKPLTLSMRLFGNIYGGEVALGVMTALTLAIIPVALFGLEVMLNLVQALIFATLTLMFTLAAIEGHHEEHEPHPEEPIATPVGPDTLDQAAAH